MSLGGESRRGGGGRLFLVALFMALGAGAALVFSSASIPSYRATAKVFVNLPAADEVSVEEAAAARGLVASYAELIASRTIAERVVEEESLSLAPTMIAERIDTDVVAGTRVIEVSFEDRNAARAQAVVNAAAGVFVSGQVGEIPLPAEAAVFERALLPADPVSPNPVRDGVVGAVLGFVFGAAVINARAGRSRRRRPEDLGLKEAAYPEASTIDEVSEVPEVEPAPPWVAEEPVESEKPAVTDSPRASIAPDISDEELDEITFDEAMSRVKAVAEEIRASRLSRSEEEEEETLPPEPDPDIEQRYEEFWEEGPRYRMGKEKEEE